MFVDKMSLEQRIRTDWFKDHRAILTNHGDLKILDWKKPGTIYYYIRYIFDGSRLYITGDLGEAVFCLTWKSDIHSFNGLDLGYFHEKLRAYHEEKYDYNSDKAVRELREWLNDLKNDGAEYDHDEMKSLFEGARYSSEKWEWVEVIRNHEDFISELDPNYWEWAYKVGRDYPARFTSYLIGLQMASEQLREGV